MNGEKIQKTKPPAVVASGGTPSKNLLHFKNRKTGEVNQKTFLTENADSVHGNRFLPDSVSSILRQ